MDYSSERSHGCRVVEYTHRGLKHISMENELLSLVIIADKGSDVVEFRFNV